MKKMIPVLALSIALSSPVSAASDFVVQNIRFDGLDGLSTSTIESYLPVKKGHRFKSSDSGAILKALYQTGFFDHIALSRSGNTLVITVEQRPMIGELKITGNSALPSDRIKEVMKSLEVAQGKVYNPGVIARIKQGLLNQYALMGYHQATVDVKTTELPRHRLAVNIQINEGQVAKIQAIHFEGNHAFSDSELRKQLSITTTGLGIVTWFTQADRFGTDKIATSIDQIRNFYLNHGYLKVSVKSDQPALTNKQQGVDLTFTISEGPQYTLQSIQFRGSTLLSDAELTQLMTVHAGDLFSREKLIDSQKAIAKAYGNKGYLFANINILPSVNDATHQVALVLEIVPGKRTYVRHINFSENARTNDAVLRREMVQMESAPASLSHLEESKHRLSLLPFIKDVNMAINPVPGVDDQVDATYNVKEDSTAQATFKVGYQDNQGLVFGVGWNQKNILGTGNTLGIDFQHSKYIQYYGLDYTNPYYTESGISRNLNLSISQTDPGNVGADNGYTSNEYNVGVLYTIPVGQEENIYKRIIAGVSLQNTLLKLTNADNRSAQLNTFIDHFGTRFYEADFKLGASRDSRDKAMLPTNGSIQSLVLDTYAPLSGHSLTFAALNYHGKWYKSLTEQFILTSRADFGYGYGFNGKNSYPFFKNFYAGGMDSVRGYNAFSLGPRNSKDKAIGAPILADASVGIIFPNYLSENLRTSLFVDAGNVYGRENNYQYGGASTNSGPIRYSVGVEADWLTPLGPIQLSLAKPIKKRERDDLEPLQFALGASF